MRGSGSPRVVEVVIASFRRRSSLNDLLFVSVTQATRLILKVMKKTPSLWIEWLSRMLCGTSLYSNLLYFSSNLFHFLLNWIDSRVKKTRNETPTVIMFPNANKASFKSTGRSKFLITIEEIERLIWYKTSAQRNASSLHWNFLTRSHHK